jgi:hypothetical protein
MGREKRENGEREERKWEESLLDNSLGNFNFHTTRSI